MRNPVSCYFLFDAEMSWNDNVKSSGASCRDSFVDGLSF